MIKQTEHTITFEGYELQNLRRILHELVYNSLIDRNTRECAFEFLEEMKEKKIGEVKTE